MSATKEDFHAKQARREGGSEEGTRRMDLFHPPLSLLTSSPPSFSAGRRVPLPRRALSEATARLKVKLGRKTRIRGVGRGRRRGGRRRTTRESSGEC